MKVLIKALLSAALMFIFVVPESLAQVTAPPNTENTDRDPYSEWDKNSDSKIDNEEFQSAFGEGDYYRSWDANSDDQLDENEWDTGISTNYSYYNDVDYGMFGDWDSDGDSYINKDEFSKRTFKLWDEDNSGFINKDEYRTWNYENIPE